MSEAIDLLCSSLAAGGVPPLLNSSCTHAAGITHRPLGNFFAPGTCPRLHQRATTRADDCPGGRSAETSSGDQKGRS